MEAKLFTFEGLKVTILHNLIILGLIASWVFIEVKILDNDVIADIGPKQSAKK